ncbi:hypothetical protein ACFXA3_04620 [Streptomyces sp. NPDC059456]|uniref:hypothetical protein n=1 Tax=Streptomyces sp. NPDC059456 TaxID=3346838 RepID=UPI0036B659D4
MRARTLRRGLTSLLVASALTALVPAATASAADPTGCDNSRAGNSTSIAPGRRIESGTRIVPTPGKPELVTQPDGNLVVHGNSVAYKKGGGPDKGGALWATGTYNKI